MSARTVEDDLSDAGLARLMSLARERFEALGGARGRVVVAALAPDEAQAIDAIWRRAARRRPRRGVDFSCSLRDLDASLRETLRVSLEEALVRVGGPLSSRPALRSARAALTAAFWEQALGHRSCEDEPLVRAWVERLRATGALGAQPYQTVRGAALTSCLDIGSTLPREPPIERSALASEMLGEPHGLDDGSPVGDRLFALLAAREGSSGTRPTAGERRALLGRFGVLCDPASATVLTLGLRPVGDAPLEQALRVLAGSHVVITLGQLSRGRPRFEPGLLVRLCENPAVVLRAEERLGEAAAPLVCTGGWPGSAVCALLDLLRDSGAAFEHHGDFDWDGLSIARWLSQRYDVRSWRFDSDAYRRAVDATRGPLARLRAPRHRHPANDPLVCELERRGVAVAEEAVLDELMADLSHSS